MKLQLSEISLSTGDVLRLELGNGIVNSWEIEAFYYGDLGQESVIEIVALGVKPPEISTYKSENYWETARMFVPANLVHRAIQTGLLTIYHTT